MAEEKTHFTEVLKNLSNLLENCFQGFLKSLITDLHLDLKNSKCWIQYGVQVNLINFYKPRPAGSIHFEFQKSD